LSNAPAFTVFIVLRPALAFAGLAAQLAAVVGSIGALCWLGAALAGA
jgi:hypothetical protein